MADNAKKVRDIIEKELGVEREKLTDDASPVNVVATRGEPGIRHRFDRRGDGVLRIRVRALRFLSLHRLERIEPLHLTGKPHREDFRIELGNSSCARHTFLQGAPSRRHIVSDGRYGT